MSESHLVLVLEPSHVHALSLETAFKQQQVCNPTRVLRNDYELRCYLEGAGIYSNRELFPHPSLLLLDFSNSLTAINILEWLGENGYLNWFPVIGVGNHHAGAVLQVAFDKGMNGYFEKPSNLTELARMICGLEWCDQWKYKLAAADNPQLLTKEQFYRMGAA